MKNLNLILFINLIVFVSILNAQNNMKINQGKQTKDSLSMLKQHANITDKETREMVANKHLEKEMAKNQKTWNTVCPIYGKKVDPKIKPVIYNGKAYGFCCEVCPPQFSKNPQKYSKNLDATGKKYIGPKDVSENVK